MIEAYVVDYRDAVAYCKSSPEASKKMLFSTHLALLSDLGLYEERDDF